MKWKVILILMVICILVPNRNSAQNLPYSVPEEKRVRVIVSTDAANEVDDAYAIVHALLTPQFIMKGIIAAHFKDRVPQSMEKSYNEVVRIVDKCGLTGQYLY